MYYGHMGLFGGFGMLVFWVAFVWLIVWLVGQNKATAERPAEILKARYARGDITKKQYEEMKKEIA
ncbi:MAG: SHOCT domain-containing protein [archaeon]